MFHWRSFRQYRSCARFDHHGSKVNLFYCYGKMKEFRVSCVNCPILLFFLNKQKDKITFHISFYRIGQTLSQQFKQQYRRNIIAKLWRRDLCVVHKSQYQIQSWKKRGAFCLPEHPTSRSLWYTLSTFAILFAFGIVVWTWTGMFVLITLGIRRLSLINHRYLAYVSQWKG